MSDAKSWTVMIYLAGDNNLSDEMIWALKEMFRVGTGGMCNVVVQFDPSALTAEPRCYNIGRIENAGERGGADVDGIIELDLLKDTLVPSSPWIQNAENSADPRVLGKFLNWTLGNPQLNAEHYMLVLSGHGNGATGGFLQDQNPRGGLTIPGLGEVLLSAREFLPKDKHLKKIDILGLDSCVMSMAEVGHEVRESVEFLVGAEGFEQNAGWPYHRVLECLRASENPSEVDPAKVAQKTVEKYFLYYSDYLAAGVSVDQSVVHLGEHWQDGLIDNFSELTRHLISAFESNNAAVKNAVVLAHWAAQSYNYEQHVDLYDFCSRLSEYLRPVRGNRSVAIRKSCGNLIRRKLWKGIVPCSLYSGPTYQHSHGLSVYFPWFEMRLDYENLAFAKDTNWNIFLRRYINETCREIRDKRYHERRKHRMLQLEALCEDGVRGAGGWPVYRAGGSSEIRGGGPNSGRGGGPNSGRGGGPNSARLSEVSKLQSMKNFPSRFFQPDIPEQSLGCLNQIKESLEEDSLRHTLMGKDPKMVASVLKKSPKVLHELENAPGQVQNNERAGERSRRNKG